MKSKMIRKPGRDVKPLTLGPLAVEPTDVSPEGLWRKMSSLSRQVTAFTNDVRGGRSLSEKRTACAPELLKQSVHMHVLRLVLIP